jgi:starch phosphorylase
MWQSLWPGRRVEEVPIGHVTNGVHLPTWMAPTMQALFDRYLPPYWRERVTDSAIWDAVDLIPDDELWETRRRLRAELVAYVRDRSTWDRLEREESTGYAEAAAGSWNTDSLTIGFARRIATYKRLYLLSIDADRGVQLLNGERHLQLVIAGKAHPRDEDAKRTVQRIFALNDRPGVGGRVVFLEEYDLGMATRLVQGCDLWINLPRPPLEASGTSGMKSALNGGLQLSVLDGWWAEAYDGCNGWAIPAEAELDASTQDQRDTERLFDLLESEIIPLYYSQGNDGLPHEWIQRIKASLRTLVPRFVASRMLEDYVTIGRSRV